LTAQVFASGDASVQSARLDSNYRYLRVDVDGHPSALLVLGYVDPHPQGDIEVWYSGTGEVIRIQNGRIVATSGLSLDWRAVRFPSTPPAWTAVPPQGVFYQRSRDEMPEHRYAITDSVLTTPAPLGPTFSTAGTLALAQSPTVRWFRDDILNSSAAPLPPAWFAWDTYRGQPTVVYSRQCLSATFCLQLLRWPLQEGAL